MSHVEKVTLIEQVGTILEQMNREVKKTKLPGFQSTNEESI